MNESKERVNNANIAKVSTAEATIAQADTAEATSAQVTSPAAPSTAASSSIVRKTYASARKFTGRINAFYLRSKGFSSYAAKRWVRAVNQEKRNVDVCMSSQEKRASYRRGFLPSTLERWGTVAATVSCVSEREYLYVHPINGRYNNWMSDRISTLSVFGAHRDLFEPYHYHVIRRDGAPFFIPLSEETATLATNMDGFVALLQSKGSLFVSSAGWKSRIAVEFQASGSDAFLLNGTAINRELLELWFEMNVKQGALVVYETRRENLFTASIAPAARASLRVLMLNSDGASPHVAQANIALSYEQTGVNEDTDEPIEDEFVMPSFEDIQNMSEEELSAIEKEKRAYLCSLSRNKKYAWHFAEVNCVTGRFCGLKHIDEQEENLSEIEQDGVKRKRTVAALAAEVCAPQSNVPFEGEVPAWAAIQAQLVALCRIVPQIEFMEFTLCVEASGVYHIVSVTPSPVYSKVIPFNEELSTFFRAKYKAKSQTYTGFKARFNRITHNTSRAIRKRFARLVAPRGLVPYQSVRWIGDMIRDNKAKTTLSRAEKRWAHKHGFLSYRLPQYEITPDNWENFISDFEYRWLRHINSKYRYWLEDKITLKFVAASYAHCFPKYYYYTSIKDGENRVVPMMDLPEGFGATESEILRLARVCGSLALKPDEGSHGEGFYKLEWDAQEGTLLLNGEAASEEHVLGILKNPQNQYIVTEYIEMHQDIAKLYPSSVNTIRITVFKPDGRTPVIGNAYFRIGSSDSGFVDNVAAGGIVAHVDIESGHFCNAKRLDGINQGNLVDCPIHPNTNMPLEGDFPHWQYVKEQVLLIAKAIPQLEYLGFDVAITPEGIKIPEINRFPDFPRVDTLEPQLIEYLLKKLEAKKHTHGYDIKPCKKLISLPKRAQDIARESENEERN